MQAASRPSVRVASPLGEALEQIEGAGPWRLFRLIESQRQEFQIGWR